MWSIQKNKREKGMTLIELVAVMSIIAVLSIFLYSSYSKQVNNSKLVGVRTDFVQMALACEQHYMETGELPVSSSAFDPTKLNKYSEITFNASGSQNKNDPFGSAYQIRYDSSSSKLTITCAGPDKNAAGTADNITLDLWVYNGKLMKESTGLGKEIKN